MHIFGVTLFGIINPYFTLKHPKMIENSHFQAKLDSSYFLTAARTHGFVNTTDNIKSSATADGPRDALC